MASREERLLNRQNARLSRVARIKNEEQNELPPQEGNEIDLEHESENESEKTSLTASAQNFNVNQLAAIVRALQPILLQQRE